MENKLAKLKYLPNNFEILENGDHVICAVSGKKIFIENLTYWNVDEQEVASWAQEDPEMIKLVDEASTLVGDV